MSTHVSPGRTLPLFDQVWHALPKTAMKQAKHDVWRLAATVIDWPDAFNGRAMMWHVQAPRGKKWSIIGWIDNEDRVHGQLEEGWL